jgi:archaemetzincin
VLDGSNHLGETDRRPPHACPVCLHKLHHSIGFDPAVRYRQLEKFYRRHRLRDEAEWVAARRTEIAAAP